MRDSLHRSFFYKKAFLPRPVIQYRRHIKRKVLQSLVLKSHTCLLFVDRERILGILPLKRRFDRRSVISLVRHLVLN